MTLKNKELNSGTVFTIEIKEGTKLFAHILSREEQAMASIVCALKMKEYQPRENDFVLKTDDVISIQFLTTDSFKLPNWECVGRHSLDYLNAHLFPLDLSGRRDAGFIGTKIIGGRIIEKFLSACFGIHPWDAWADPNYLDSFLLPAVEKPPLVRYKSDFNNVQ